MELFKYSFAENDGAFFAEVTAKDGKSIFNLEAKADENISLIDAGYMKHLFDHDGLTGFLREFQLIGPRDLVIME